jgi:uncharacterized protein (TIGR03083 family)
MMAGPTREIDALEEQCAVLHRLLEPLSAAEWVRPTRCPPLDVRGLTAHLVSQLRRLAAVRDIPAVDDMPRKDRLSWWDYDVDEDKEETLNATLEAAFELPPGPLAGAFAAAARGAVEGCRTRLADGDAVLAPGDEPIVLSEYIATRVLEATIHGMDLADAVGRDPQPAASAMGVTGDILRGLLGTDPRPAISDERLAIVGTGRGDLTAAEAAALGGAVRALPLLA